MQGRKDGKKEGMQETLSYMFVKVHEKKLSHCFTNNENELDEDISYMQWISTDRITINKLTSTIEKYINLLSKKVFQLCQHHLSSI